MRDDDLFDEPPPRRPHAGPREDAGWDEAPPRRRTAGRGDAGWDDPARDAGWDDAGRDDDTRDDIGRGRAARGRKDEPNNLLWLAVTAVVVVAVLAIVVAGTRARATVTTAAWRSGVTADTTAAVPSPSPSVPAGPVVTLPATYTVPGTPPRPDWPGTGQAALEVLGIGSLGATPGQRPVPIASVTKVMTAYLVLHDHPLGTGSSGPTITVTDAEAAAYPSQVALNESLVKVAAGETLTERQALEALMLPSADNMALILARWDAGSVDAFVTRMNTTAASLGMRDTHYTDPSGLAADTRSTAADQVVLAERAVQIATFTQIVALSSAVIPVAGTIHNVNTELGVDGINGIKTGSTSAAGGCLLFSARHSAGGRTVTIVGAVFGQHGSTQYGLPLALSASRELVEGADQVVKAYTPVTAGQTVATLGGVGLVADHTVTVVGWPGLSFTTQVRVEPDPLPGTAAGTVEVVGPGTRQTTTLHLAQ